MSDRQPRPNLRRARLRRGWSAETAADQIHLKAAEKGIPPELIDIDARQLVRWESGETKTPRRLNIWLLSETYGLAPEQLDLPPVPGCLPHIQSAPVDRLAAALDLTVEHVVAPAQPSRQIRGRAGKRTLLHLEDDYTKRRDFVNVLTATALGMLDVERLAAAIGASPVADGRLLGDLEALGREYGRMYWSMSPVAMWLTLYSHTAVTRRIHETAPPGLQRRAASVAGQAASLLGMLAHRLHRRLDSVMYLNLASELAAEAGDGPLRAHALVALRAAYSPVTGAGVRADPGKALQLTSEAASVADRAATPLLRTWLYACRAEDHAVLAQISEVARDMEAAEAALAQASSRSGDFFDHWDSARLAGFRGNCAVLLGQPGEAIPVLESVARNTSPTLVSPYTAVLTDLAAAYGQRGEVERACAILGDVLTTASRAGRPERAGRVQRTRNAHLAGWADSHAVRALDDHLRQFNIGGNAL